MTFKKILLSLFLPAALSGYSQSVIDSVWTLVSDATGGDYVTDLYVTPNGNSYVLGHIGQLPGNPNVDGLMLLKSDSDGAEVWRQYIFPVNGNWGLFAKGVTGDMQGNVYVLFNENYRYSDHASARVLLRKYDAAGSILWTQCITPDQNGLIESPATRQLIYKDGFLFCGGSLYQDVLASGSSMDGLIYKFDADDGSVVNRITYNSSYNSDDLFRDIHVDAAGSIWAIGRSRGYAGPGGVYSHYDSLTARYSPEGNLLWQHRLNGSGNSEDWGINLDVDANGNAVISSQLKALSISQKQVHAQKLSSSGVVQWTHTYQGSSSEYNWDQPVEFMPNGNVLLVNSCADGIRSVALNAASGAVIWENFYERDDTGAYNRPRHTLVDDQGNIYITGRSRDNTPMGDGYDMATLKYSPSGELLWESHYSYGNYDTAGDEGVKLGLDASGNLYAIGWIQDAANNDDFALLKYGASSLSVQPFTAENTKVYPNPAVDFVRVRSDVALTSAELYDLGGRLVRQWKLSTPDERLDLEGIAPSVYLLQVRTTDGSSSFKISKM